MDAKELDALKLLHYSPVDENVGLLGAPFPVVHKGATFWSRSTVSTAPTVLLQYCSLPDTAQKDNVHTLPHREVKFEHSK